MSDVYMSFIAHLEELRKRLIAVVMTVVIGAVISYIFIEQIVAWLLIPGAGAEFVYIAPPELFLAYLRIALSCGLVFAMPVVLFQIWRFVRPALDKREREAVRVVIWGGVFFFLIGMAFGYSVILPVSLRFFLKYATETVQPLFSFGAYVGYIFSLLFAFGLGFELPIVVVLCAKMGLVSRKSLRAGRKFVLLGLVIVSAVLTPPDIFSQILLAGPLMLLYEVGHVMAAVLVFRRSDSAG